MGHRFRTVKTAPVFLLSNCIDGVMKGAREEGRRGKEKEGEGRRRKEREGEGRRGKEREGDGRRGNKRREGKKENNRYGM
jgi:hypothetical protein